MSGEKSAFVPVRRDVLAELQASAAGGWQSAKERTADELRALPGTVRTTVAPIGVGAILAFVATMDDVKNNKTIKENWWLLPAAVLVVGYILRRRNSPHATAVLAAGAVLFVQAWRNAPKKKEEVDPTAAQKQFQQFKPAGDTAGMPTMHPIDDRTAWIQSGGQWVRVQLAAPVRPALPVQTSMPQPGAQQAAAANTMPDAAAALAAAAFAS